MSNLKDTYIILPEQLMTPGKIGYWAGHEDEAIFQFNRLLDCIARQLKHDQKDFFEELALNAWKRFQSCPKLLEMEFGDMEDYVMELIKRTWYRKAISANNHTIPIPTNKNFL